MQHTFPCYRCGAHNIIGVKNCANCYSPFYYNCPHCSAWVDNTFVNCPTCRNDLNWPATATDGDTVYGATVYGATHIKSGYTVSHGKRSAWPAVLLSLLGAVAVLVIPISLAASNSLSPKPAVNQSSTTSADSSQAIHPAQLYSPKPNTTPTPDNTQAPNISPSTDTIYSSTYSTIPSPPSSSLYIAPGSYNPGASAYLRSIYPNWGVCVGGSCSRFTQSQ
ncbi:MAG: hypothetical protein ACYDHZ_00160 [Dehalococcoidia bacterium]